MGLLPVAGTWLVLAADRDRRPPRPPALGSGREDKNAPAQAARGGTRAARAAGVRRSVSPAQVVRGCGPSVGADVRPDDRRSSVSLVRLRRPRRSAKSPSRRLVTPATGRVGAC